jgi:hypothetical protein
MNILLFAAEHRKPSVRTLDYVHRSFLEMLRLQLMISLSTIQSYLAFCKGVRLNLWLYMLYFCHLSA